MQMDHLDQLARSIVSVADRSSFLNVIAIGLLTLVSVHALRLLFAVASALRHEITKAVLTLKHGAEEKKITVDASDPQSIRKLIAAFKELENAPHNSPGGK